MEFGFKWHLKSPYAALMHLPLLPRPGASSLGALILPVLLTMAMNFGKVLVGMVIVAIPTLPIILKLRNSRG